MIQTVIIAGFPAGGKSAVIRWLVRDSVLEGFRPAVAGLRCYSGAEQRPSWALSIPWRTWVSEAYCPDYELVQRLEEIRSWAKEEGAGVIFVETAGLCARCSPFPERCVAIFAADYTAGLRMPDKVGPMLTTCDISACTRPDRASQTERMMFQQRLRRVNPGCFVVAVNGLTGEGGPELWQRVARELGDWPTQDTKAGVGQLRTSLPQFYCSFCLGSDQVGIHSI